MQAENKSQPILESLRDQPQTTQWFVLDINYKIVWFDFEGVNLFLILQLVTCDTITISSHVLKCT